MTVRFNGRTSCDGRCLNSAIRLVLFAGLASSVGLAGCSGDGSSSAADQPSENVAPSEFIRPAERPHAESSPVKDGASDARNVSESVESNQTQPQERTKRAEVARPASTMTMNGAGTVAGDRPEPAHRSEPRTVMNLTGDSDATMSVGSPKLDSGSEARGQAVILEAHVGQVNGRPIFASEILEPLDGRLRAIGLESKTREQWQRLAGKSVYDELIRRVRDELVLAEARANLTPEQRQGLVFFLGEIQKGLVSGSGGSTVAADEQSRESSARSLARETQDQLDRELIANEMRQNVVPRVAVPWRDVQMEYEKNLDKYNPPPTAHLRMILVETSNAEGVSKVNASLASGLAFSEVASAKPNEFNRSKAGEFDREFTGAYSEFKFSEVKEVNQAMQQLSPGQTIGPFTYRNNTGWVHLESIEQKPSQSLYEVQHEIEQGLREERFRQEETRYFDRLLKRGNVSKFEDMMARLLAIAQERYLPEGLANTPARGPSVRPVR